jgi:uncharacterized protein YbjT (DUF2867 family)
MSVSPAYLEATVNTAAVARHHGVEAFLNMSQMTVTQMSITETTDSPQHKLHWLAEQALSWSGLPVVTLRPTVLAGSLTSAIETEQESRAALAPGRSRSLPRQADAAILASTLPTQYRSLRRIFQVSRSWQDFWNTSLA